MVIVIVAPYVGAWIETQSSQYHYQKKLVAPYVGAWIETGLGQIYLQGQLVAPYVGAWIETGMSGGDRQKTGSHPTWVRGLKPLVGRACVGVCGRTLRGCVD